MPLANVAHFRRFSPALRPYRSRLLLALGASTTRPLLGAARVWLLKVLIDGVLRGQETMLLILRHSAH